MIPRALKRKFTLRRETALEPAVLPPRKRRRAGKTLRSVGGLCFDYLTREVSWEDEGVDGRTLRSIFAAQFEAVIRENEAARFADDGETRRYGPITIEGREGMPHYVKHTLKRMDSMPPVSWPDVTVIWIDFHPNAIYVRVRDADDRFWQSLKSCLDRRRKAKK